MSETVLVEVRDHIATVTLNRPEKLNAMSGELMDTLPEKLGRLAEDSDVRCVILTGAGRGFCAGGDVSGMGAGAAAAGEMPPTLEQAVAGLRQRERSSELLHEMAKPTIAMVNGPAAGAGLSLALACDIRYAAESARFGTAFVRVGFSGDFGGSWMLQRLVGPALARELYFTGELIDAQEALRIGLVNQVFPDGELARETYALAKRIAQGPPIALARMKANFNRALETDFATLLDIEAENMVFTGLTEDNREAIKAFLEKRQPKFVGR